MPWKKACTVYRSLHDTAGRIDNHYHVGKIYVGPYLPVNEFQFVQVAERPSVHPDLEGLLDLEILVHEVD